MTQMPTHCAECGAVLRENQSCEEIFQSFLALEFSNPEYGEVHFLTVACYMIQHGRYSDESLTWIRKMLRRYLDEGLSAAQIRQLAAQETAQGRRAGRITRAADAPPPPPVAWAMTIVDVARAYRDAASYRRWITQWARETLKQMPLP